MFGFSFSKIIVLALVVAAVWYGFKYMNRLEEIRRLLRQQQNRQSRPAAAASRLQAEDLVPCRVCNAYVAARGGSACGRADCPWPR
jgi:uncharacterized protein